jgi:hypothetical protein
MRKVTWLALMVLGGAIAASPAHAVVCAKGVYRAGCTGSNGTTVVRKAPKPTVTCAKGVYRAGCVGPNGGAAVRRSY